nr:basic helix-loop-helix family protein [Rosa persica]
MLIWCRIPNSNKTDKASMMDEAIDYLKQLQLQVQVSRSGLEPFTTSEKAKKERGKKGGKEETSVTIDRLQDFRSSLQVDCSTVLNSELSFGTEKDYEFLGKISLATENPGGFINGKS